MGISVHVHKKIKTVPKFINSIVGIGSRNSLVIHQDSTSLKELSEAVEDIAGVLMNIVVIGKEKRKICRHFEPVKGVCNFLNLDNNIPTLTTIPDGGRFKILVSSHPEICAVCPYWSTRS
ncbi:MAG: hypothetical protein QW101_03425 [Ignisphaera sp.]|uniref:Uncharacterized protein n=1 Tax=Ignisphaera aggregans TaxID=334771 RepID=A0A7J3MY87_9CREN